MKEKAHFNCPQLITLEKGKEPAKNCATVFAKCKQFLSKRNLVEFSDFKQFHFHFLPSKRIDARKTPNLDKQIDEIHFRLGL